MFVTDGVLDRKAARSDVRAILAESRGDHPRAAVQRVIEAAADASDGQLEDGATAVCFDWHGGPPRARKTSAGADVAPEA